jgi:outer membrane protein TolC
MKHVLYVFLLAASLHAQAIHVDDVIDSVKKRYPALLVALADRDIADSDVLAAEGRFDMTLRTRIDTDSFGYYANRRIDSWIEQPLSWQGMSLYSGYRVGDGEFAPYDGKLATRSLGEVRSGFKLPLLRDREIDTRRGELAKARIGRKLADLSVDQQKLAVLQSAISRYWTWVALGRRLAVTRDVLEIAEARQKLLEEGVREGQIPRIEAIDNERAILQRRSSTVEAERAFQQSSSSCRSSIATQAARPWCRRWTGSRHVLATQRCCLFRMSPPTSAPRSNDGRRSRGCRHTPIRTTLMCAWHAIAPNPLLT